MAIEKDIAIKCKNEKVSGEKGIAQLISYITDDHHNHEKTNINVANVLAYTQNAEKTTLTEENLQPSHVGNKDILISYISNGELCPLMDETDFMEDKEKYLQYKKSDRRGMGRVDKGEAQAHDAYHVIQSFPGEEQGVDLNPRLAHQLGIEYAKRAFPGHKVVVTTHMNTEHIHNHIAVCAYNEDGKHKLNFDNRFRRRIRKINDEINLKHDLPVLQEYAPYMPHDAGYEEDLVRKSSGKSMKDQVREDIHYVLSNRGRDIRDFDDFVELMQKHMNYEIRQTDKSVTYIKKDLLMKNGEPFRCRDNSLGDEYMRCNICSKYSYPKWSKTVDGRKYTEAELSQYARKTKISQYVTKSRKGQNIEPYEVKINLYPGYMYEQDHIISIKRYTETGRRRSNLELVLMAAIQLVKYIINRVMKLVTSVGMINRALENKREKNITVKADFDTEKTLAGFEQALFQVRKHDLQSFRDIDSLSDSLKQDIEMIKAEKAVHTEQTDKAKASLQIIREFKDLEAVLKKRGFQLTDRFLCIHTPTEKEMRLLRQANSPITGRQKQKLHQLLNKDGQKYTLKCRFDELDSVAADEVIRFLSGDRTVKPEMIADPEEQKTEKMERMYEKIFDKIESGKETNPKLNVPISKALIERLKPLITEAGIRIDLTKLTTGQGLSILQHLKEIPLTEDRTITKTQAEAIERRLESKGLKLNKPAEYVLRSEYDQLKSYLKTGKGKTPEALQEFKPLTLCTKTQIEELLKLTGRTLSVSMKYISEQQGEILLSDLLYKRFVPRILKTKEAEVLTWDAMQNLNNDLKEQFVEKIAVYDEGIQRKLLKARDYIINLYGRGETVESKSRLMGEVVQDAHLMKPLKLQLKDVEKELMAVDSIKSQVSLANSMIESPRKYVTIVQKQTTEQEQRVEISQDPGTELENPKKSVKEPEPEQEERVVGPYYSLEDGLEL